MDVVALIWHRALNRQDLAPGWVCAVTAIGALLLVIPRPAWSVSRHLITLGHEAAHGVVALLVGRRLAGIRLHSDTSGLTVSHGKPRGPGMVATLLAGYPGPSIFGLGAAAVLGTGHAVALLWIALILLALLLLQIRNWFGLWSVLVTGSVVFGASRWLDETWQSAFGYLITWFLLLGAGRPVLELRGRGRGRRRSLGRDSDADQLARLTGIPGMMWVMLFGAISIGALLLGGNWLTAPYRN